MDASDLYLRLVEMAHIERKVDFIILIPVLLLFACSPSFPAPTPSPASIPVSTPISIASPTIGTNQNVGVLAGRVTVGPLVPVERIGVPTPTPPPAVFASRSINIFAADGATLVTNVKINPDGTYRVTLPSGIYVVDIARSGIDRARDLPKRITIESGKTVQLDIDIDTGIR